MESAQWSGDELSYLLAYVLANAAGNDGEDSVQGSVWYLEWNVLPDCRPFSSWPDDRRQAIAREVFLELARRDLAEFFPTSGTYYSWEETLAWRRDMMAEADLEALLDAELPRWWAGESREPYHYWLTQTGMEIADAIELDELAKRVGDYPRKGPLVILSEEDEALRQMAPDDRDRWEEQRKRELTGMTGDEISRWVTARREQWTAAKREQPGKGGLASAGVQGLFKKLQRRLSGSRDG